MNPTTKGKRVCVFCNLSDGPFHKEDVFPKWIPKALGIASTLVTPLAGGRKPYGIAKSIGVVTRAPCQGCNNGWMSDLEKEAKPLLLPMMLGQPTHLDEAGQTTVAHWVLKTVMMYDLITPERPTRFFRREDYRAFHDSREIPPDSLIHLARMHFKEPRGLARDFTFSLVPGPETPDARPIDAYSATLTIHRLAFQFFSVRRPKDVNDAIRLVLPGPWDLATITIWPRVPKGVVWPPAQAIDDDGFTQFAERWLTLK